MSIVKTVFFIILLFFSSFPSLTAQSPYQLQLKQELIYAGTGIGLTAFGAYLRGKSPIFTPDELTTFDPQDVNTFDRIATGLNSDRADRASDVLLYSSFALPTLALFDQKTRRDVPIILALWGEVVAINRGTTLIFKHTLQRPRPLVFNPNVDLSFKQANDVRASFISGHTSKTTSNFWFMAKVFSDYYPDSPLKPVVWGLAIAAPAVNGYLRVRAGKHYPTDVIGGYVVGAAIGFLVPHLHRKDRKNDRVSWQVSANGMQLQIALR